MEKAYYGNDLNYDRSDAKGWFAGLFSGISWGLDTSLLRFVLTLVPFLVDPVLAVGGYFVCCLIHELIGVVGMGTILAGKKELGHIFRLMGTREGLLIMIGALLGGPFAMTCYIFALAKGGLALTAGITSAYPLICTVLAVILLKERLRPRSWLGIMVAVLGVFYLWYIPGEEMGFSSLSGTLLATGTALGWATEGIIVSLGMKNGKISHVKGMFIREVTSSIVYLIFVPIFLGGLGNLHHAVREIFTYTEAWVLLLVAAIIGVISYYNWYKSINIIGAARAVCLNISYSFWAVLFGALLFNIAMNSYDYFGSLLVIAGVCIATIYYPKKFMFQRLRRSLHLDRRKN